MVQAVLLLTLAACSFPAPQKFAHPGWGPPGQAGGKFAPGWNGMARTPPMGWRSWNAFEYHISETLFIDVIDAFTAKSWSINGDNVSLADIGYESIGIDEGWEGCGMGYNESQHYLNGTPAVNSKFPNMKKIVQYAHEKNMTMGFYENGCACPEKVAKLANYKGDVKYLQDQGFDGVKLDYCGAQRNLTLYAELMKATGRTFSIESSHWGICTHDDNSGCPSTEWCPYNWFRTSLGITTADMAWFKNLQTTVPFLSWSAPISQPGCWAYPDTLEIGRVVASASWNRAHFGAWCIVSSPLILGVNPTQANLEPIIDVISNVEAIAINQQWAGHPGGLVWTKSVFPPPPFYISGLPCDGSKAQDVFTYNLLQKQLQAIPASSEGQTYCFDSVDISHVALKECDQSSSTQMWDWDGQHYTQGQKRQSCLSVQGNQVGVEACKAGASNQRFLQPFGKSLKTPTNICLQPTIAKPGGGPPPLDWSLQLWAKPQAQGGVAVLLINANTDVTANATVQFKDVNMSGLVSVRNVWTREHMGFFSGQISLNISAQDSAFMMLYPAVGEAGGL